MAFQLSFTPFLLEKLRFVLESPRFGFEADEREKCFSLLGRLKSALESIYDVITHEEEGQLRLDARGRSNDREFAPWVDENALDEAMNFLDEIFYEAARPTPEPHDLKHGDLSGSIEQLVTQMEGIRDRNRFIASEKDISGLRKVEAHYELRLSDSLPPATLQHDETANETTVYGRDKDRSEIVRLLLSGAENLDVIALVGVAGVGKTTLAQLVYQDQEVSEHFDLKAWIGVFKDFNFLRITREIVEATSPTAGLRSFKLDKIQAHLDATLAEKKLLLVLDDMQEECIQRGDINQLSPYALNGFLRSVARGSTILITTDSKEVANIMACSVCYDLEQLTEDDCWSVLAKSAFSGRGTSEVETLQDIGKEFVEKYCRGIPLYARAIGGILRFKKTQEEWRRIMEELNNSFETYRGFGISPILLLSYFHLPAQLKGCFAYCSLFPRGYKFEKGELVLLWLQAEGFLQKSSGPSMEELSAEYFEGLLKRSFSIPVDNSHFRIHGLMHDLAEFVSARVCVKLEPAWKRFVFGKSQGIRHLSLLRSGLGDFKSEATRLRTLYVINPPQSASSELELILPTQQKLRVLSIPHFQHAELPASIKNLKFLRYLDLSHSALRSLPKSLCTLYLLQTLLLTNCFNLRILPRGIVELVNLRKLHIKGANLEQMPEDMSKLTSLRSLSNFIVGKGGSSIKELGSLRGIHGALSVSKLQNVYSASDASEANLEAMQYLGELELEWSGENDAPAADQKEVLENLKPSAELKSLSIRFYGGEEFPKWLGDSSFSITSLQLVDCSNCESLPPLGRLSSLQHLTIERMSGIRVIGPEFFGLHDPGYKSFQSLKTLKFGEMSKWEEWILPEVEGVEFPYLEEFSIVGCPVLEGSLPKSLPTLMKIEITECDEKLAVPKTSEGCVRKLDKPYKEQEDNQIESSSSEDEDMQSFLSLSFSGIGMTELKKLPTDLYSLRIERYASDELPKEILERSSLHHLYIIDCFSLKIFPQSPSLKTLYIQNCKRLKFPQPNKVMNQNGDLEKLCLGSSFDSLKIFPLNHFPNLKALSLWDCTNLEHLSIEKGSQNKLTSLESLEIKDCPKFRSFLEEEFQAPNLRSLAFFNCGSLKQLRQLQSLKSLQSLYINRCPGLESLPVDGLRSLRTLCISFCDKITPHKEWKLHELHSLSHFEIEGGCQNMESFSEEGILLPKTLRSLRISNLPQLKFLEREGLQKLTSLQKLEINCCNNLDSLPEDGLPSSLSSLSVRGCSLLNPKTADEGKDEGVAFKDSKTPDILSLRFPRLTEGKDEGVAFKDSKTPDILSLRFPRLTVGEIKELRERLNVLPLETSIGEIKELSERLNVKEAELIELAKERLKELIEERLNVKEAELTKLAEETPLEIKELRERPKVKDAELAELVHERLLEIREWEFKAKEKVIKE